MTTLRKSLLVALASMALSAPAMAFTPSGEVLETADSLTSTTWQVMTSERGDTISEACEGFTYTQCVRDFVTANRDKFPAQFRSEEDFFLAIGVDYIVPIRTADAAPVVAETLAPNASLLDIVNGMTLEQERLVAQVAELSEAITNQTFGVDDIDGLADRFRQIDANIPNIGPLRATMQELERAFELLQAGELTDELKTSINGAVQAALGDYETRLAGLEATTITFEARLTSLAATTAGQGEAITALQDKNGALEGRIIATDGRITAVDERVASAEGRLTDVETLAARPAFYELFNSIGLGQWYADNSGKGQILLFGIPLILISALLMMFGGLLRNLWIRVTELEKTVAPLVEISENDIKWADGNASPEDLTKLSKGEDDAVTWVLWLKSTGARYEVTIGRDDKTPQGQVETDILRKIGETQTVPPIAIRRLKLRIREAIGSGRLQPAPAVVTSVAAE